LAGASGGFCFGAALRGSPCALAMVGAEMTSAASTIARESLDVIHEV